MRLIAVRHLIAFAAENPHAATALVAWRALVAAADWKSMNDVRAATSTAKVLNADRVRFEIAGGRFRLIAAFNFQRSIVFIKFIGSHADYDRLDALTAAQF